MHNNLLPNWYRKRLIVDGHCDTMLDVLRDKRRLGNQSEEGQVDLPRLLNAGVGVQFFAIFIESIYKPYGALLRALQVLDVFYQELNANSDKMGLVEFVEDLNPLLANHKLAAILAIEGGEALGGQIGVLRMLFKLGVRSIGLTWNQRNELADGIGERNTNGGLTLFGHAVVQEMNQLGMLIDLAHISERGFFDVLHLTGRPVIVSHANCRHLFNHPRNLTDRQLRALTQNGGVIGITFAPEFVDQKSSIEKVANHIDYAVQIMGIEHVGIGSDFDGTSHKTCGLETVDFLPSLFEILDRRGYSEEAVQNIMSRNWLRILRSELPSKN